MPGSTFAARVGASLAHAAGLPELIAPDLAAYRDLALALATDPARLAALRARLAALRLACSLFDTDGFARALDAAFREMWRRHEAGEAAAAFAVAG